MKLDLILEASVTGCGGVSTRKSADPRQTLRVHLFTVGYAAPLGLTTGVNPMRISATFVSLILALGSASAVAADPPAQSAAPTPAVQGQATPNADNTSINVRDRDGATQTPQKQTTGVDDRELVAAVRRAVVDDKSLSTSAHNVKIVANNGVVTLRGPVRSNDERVKVEKLAQQVTGVSSVENELDIKTVNSK